MVKVGDKIVIDSGTVLTFGIVEQVQAGRVTIRVCEATREVKDKRAVMRPIWNKDQYRTSWSASNLSLFEEHKVYTCFSYINEV